MATSVLSPAAQAPRDNQLTGSSTKFKSYFLQNPIQLLSLPSSLSRSRTARRCCYYRSPVARNLDHIPKQFRGENLKDGLMQNYKNVPKFLYGLTPSQLDMFMTEDNPVRRQSELVTEESISSARNYINQGGICTLSEGSDGAPSYKYSMNSMSSNMYYGGSNRDGRPKTAPPDLPSLLLDARICYLGMPIVPAVTELIVAQMIYLEYDDPSKPIYLYINSSGTQDEKMEAVGTETDAYAIADCMGYCRSEVYTVNCGMAYGQAALLLAVGEEGHRGLLPHCTTKLYMPKVNRSSGSVIDIWIKAKELDANTDSYIDILSEVTGKDREEIAEDIQRPKYFRPEEAIEYGLADKILGAADAKAERRDYEGILAQQLAGQVQGGAGGPQASPSGFR